jgi:hypothetical protein
MLGRRPSSGRLLLWQREKRRLTTREVQQSKLSLSLLERNPSHRICRCDHLRGRFLPASLGYLIGSGGGARHGVTRRRCGDAGGVQAFGAPIVPTSARGGTGLLPSLRLAASTARENWYHRPGAAIGTHMTHAASARPRKQRCPDDRHITPRRSSTDPAVSAERSVLVVTQLSCVQSEPFSETSHTFNPTFASWAPDDDGSASLTESAASKEAVCTPSCRRKGSGRAARGVATNRRSTSAYRVEEASPALP